MRRRLFVLASALAAAPRARAAFPQRPITLVVPFAPGGVADITARAVGEAMGRRLGQTVVVDDRPSAGGIVGSQAVAAAKPDGQTLLLMSNANALAASLFRKLPYDAQKAFAPVATLAFFDLGLFVDAASPLRTLGDALARAKAQPGRLTVGTIAVGSTQHLAAKLFQSTTGADFLVVPYKGTPALVTALRSGEVDLAFEIVAPMAPQVAAGTLRALAVTGAKRSSALPGVPTAAEAGVRGYEVASWNALAAPAGTPPEVIAKLNAAARAAVADAAVAERLAPLGVRLEAGTPAALQALLARETERWAAVIRAAKIEPQ